LGSEITPNREDGAVKNEKKDQNGLFLKIVTKINTRKALTSAKSNVLAGEYT
jgi:hypothetical protein